MTLVSLVYLASTQEHTIHLCIKILQILIDSELSWFWIAGRGRFLYLCTFYVPLCSKKLNVHCTLLVLIDFCLVYSELLTWISTFGILPEIIIEYQI